MPELPVSTRVALSFAAAFAGWTAGLAWRVLCQTLLAPPGYLTDFESVALWSGMFVFATWLLVLAPLVARVDPDHPIHRAAAALPLGAVAGIASCTVLLVPLSAAPLIAEPMFLAHAAIVGAITWVTYAALARRWHWLERHPAAGGWLCAASPATAVATFLLVVLPAIESLAPALAYRHGTDAVRHRVFARTLRALRIGDSFEELRATLPGAFRPDTTRSAGNAGPGFSYRLEFGGGRVTAIELRGS